MASGAYRSRHILSSIRFPPLEVHGVDLYILFLETAFVFLCIFLKQYSMDINNLKKVLILPGVSGIMSILHDRLMCINYLMSGGYYHKIVHENLSM